MVDNPDPRIFRDLERRIEALERLEQNGWRDYKKQVIRMVDDWQTWQQERGAAKRDRLLLVGVVSAIGVAVLNWFVRVLS